MPANIQVQDTTQEKDSQTSDLTQQGNDPHDLVQVSRVPWLSHRQQLQVCVQNYVTKSVPSFQILQPLYLPEHAA